MPLIIPIKDLRNATEISNLVHKEPELLDGAEAIDAELAFAALEKNILDKYTVNLHRKLYNYLSWR